MTKRPNRISLEVIDSEDMVLTDELIKKLRASSSMFNKSTYVQVQRDGVRYNVESVDRLKNGAYRISLISTVALMTLGGTRGSTVDIVKYSAY